MDGSNVRSASQAFSEQESATRSVRSKVSQSSSPSYQSALQSAPILNASSETRTGLSSRSVFSIFNQANPKEPLSVSEAGELLELSTTNITESDLSFSIFLHQLKTETSFDQSKHALFAILGTNELLGANALVPTVYQNIKNEMKWRQYLRIRATTSCNFQFFFLDPKDFRDFAMHRPLGHTLQEETPAINYALETDLNNAPQHIEAGDIEMQDAIEDITEHHSVVLQDTDNGADENSSVMPEGLAASQTPNTTPVSSAQVLDSRNSSFQSSAAVGISSSTALTLGSIADQEPFNIYATTSEEEDKLLKDGTEWLRASTNKSVPALEDDGSSNDNDVFKRLLSPDLTIAERASLMSQTGAKIAECFSEETAVQAAKFFKIRLVDLYNREFFSDLGGMFRKKLRSTQLYALFYLLNKEIKECTTGFLCDGCGVGKTYTTMPIPLITKLMRDNQNMVTKSRRLKDGKHLPKGQTGRCPTGSGHFFDCACESGSLASSYKPTNGINILVTNNSAIPKMVKEWVGLVPIRHGMQIFVDTHDKFKKTEEWGTKEWTEDEMDKYAMYEGFKPEPKAENVLLIMNAINWSARIEKHLGNVPAMANRDAFLTKDLGLHSKEPEYQAALTRYNSGFTIGRIIVDECHDLKGEHHQFMKWLLKTPTKIRIFCQTGTPYNNKGMAPIAIWIRILSRHNDWSKRPDSAVLEDQKIKTINQNYSHAIKRGPAAEKDLCKGLKSMSEITKAINMIRRNDMTEWIDRQPLVMVPPYKTEKYHLEIKDPELVAYYLRIKTGVYQSIKNITVDSFRRGANSLMVSATFPAALPELLKPKKERMFDGNDFSLQDQDVCRFAMTLDDRSTKWEHFTQKLKGLLPEDWKHGEDAPFKVLVFTQHPATAKTWSLLCEREFGKSSTYCWSNESTVDTKELMQAYFDTDEERIEGLTDGQKKLKKQAMIFVSTYRLAATAINLREAEYVWQLEPPYDQNWDEQSIGRAARFGQRRVVTVIRQTTIEEEKTMVESNDLVGALKEIAARVLRAPSESTLEGVN